MTPADAAKILTIAGAYDNRRIDELTATAWAEALYDVPYEAAKDAVVAHYREERKWIMPADILQRAKKSTLPTASQWQPDRISIQLKEAAKFTDEEFDHLVTEFRNAHDPDFRCPLRDWGNSFDHMVEERARAQGVAVFRQRRLNPKVDQWIYN